MPADEAGVEQLLRELGHLSNPTQIIVGLSELLLEDQSLSPGLRPRLEQLHRSAVNLAARSDMTGTLRATPGRPPVAGVTSQLWPDDPGGRAQAASD